MSSKTCGICEKDWRKRQRKEKNASGRDGSLAWTRRALIIAAAAAGEEGMRV
jgi:hypothetical protein